MSILDRLNDDNLDRIYTLLQAYAAAPDSLSTYRNFMAQAKFGHTSIRFGGEILGWYGVIYFGDNHFCIPETEQMTSRQQRLAHQANIQLGLLKEELFPRIGRKPNPSPNWFTNDFPYWAGPGVSSEDESPFINNWSDSIPEEDKPEPNAMMACPRCDTRIVYTPQKESHIQCPVCNAYIIFEDPEAENTQIHVVKGKV